MGLGKFKMSQIGIRVANFGSILATLMLNCDVLAIFKLQTTAD